MKHFLLTLAAVSSVLSFAYLSNAQSVPIVAGPNEPTIAISPDYYYPLEELLYIEGRANPNATVTVTLTKEASAANVGDKPVKFTIKADSIGEWVVAEKVYLSSGNWQVRARQLVGTQVSPESNPRVIRSVVTGVSIFGMQIRYVVIVSVIFAFIAIIVFIYIYFHRKIRRLKRGLMQKQLRETEDRFHKGFAAIRKDLMDQLRELAANAQSRPLTPEEVEKKDRILRELENLEQNLEHDLTDIGRRY
jgi:hypothetical protein